LQGANLYEAQLQGAELIRTELQGALSLSSTRLEGALLCSDYVWRTAPPSSALQAVVVQPEPEPIYSGLDCAVGKEPCNWSEKSFAALKSLIENEVPVGQRDQALRQIARTLEKPPYVADEASAKAWTDLAKGSACPAGSYFNTLAKTFIEIGCAAEGGPYVIGSLLRPIAYQVLLDLRFAGNLSEEAEVAAAFLDKEKCLGARGLSEENKAKLRGIRDRGLLAPTGPGTASR
jgi:hypothetical protein